jgi:hypothetical protein
MCRICQYNQIKDVDRALLAGISLATLSQRYSFTVPELEHHQAHLHRKMALAAERFHAYLHQGLVCKLNIVMEMTLTVIRKTKNDPDPKLFLQAGREYTRMLNLMDKMAHRLAPDPEFLYCLTASRQWDQQEDALLPYAFPALNETRQSMQLYLFTPCPEPPAEPVPAPTSNATDTRPGEHQGRDGRAADVAVSFLPARSPQEAPARPDACATNVRHLSEKLAGWKRDACGIEAE